MVTRPSDDEAELMKKLRNAEGVTNALGELETEFTRIEKQQED